MKLLRHILLTLPLCFFMVNATAASFGSVIDELFGDDAELSAPLVECRSEENLSSGFRCSSSFQFKYKGDYRLALFLDFNPVYEQNTLPQFQDLSKEEREVIHKANAAILVSRLSISAENTQLVNDDLSIEVGPTIVGKTIRIIEVPTDLETGVFYRLEFEVPRSNGQNDLIYARYKTMTLVLRRLSSVSR